MTESNNEFVKINQTILISDMRISDDLIGSGFDMYEWWGRIGVDLNGFTIKAGDPDDSNDWDTKFISFDDIRKAIVKIMNGEIEAYGARSDLFASLDHGIMTFDEIDAASGDNIMQIAFFGEVIYG